MGFQAEIIRVNKTTDTHGKLSSVEYVYKLNYKQMHLLEDIILMIGSRETSISNHLKTMRQVLRTHEYSDTTIPILLEVRQWYITQRDINRNKK